MYNTNTTNNNTKTTDNTTKDKEPIIINTNYPTNTGWDIDFVFGYRV